MLSRSAVPLVYGPYRGGTEFPQGGGKRSVAGSVGDGEVETQVRLGKALRFVTAVPPARAFVAVGGALGSEGGGGRLDRLLGPDQLIPRYPSDAAGRQAPGRRERDRGRRPGSAFGLTLTLTMPRALSVRAAYLIVTWPSPKCSASSVSVPCAAGPAPVPVQRLADSRFIPSPVRPGDALAKRPGVLSRCGSVSHPARSHRLPGGGPGLIRLHGAGFLLGVPTKPASWGPLLLHRRVPSTAGSYLGSTGPSATDGERE